MPAAALVGGSIISGVLGAHGASSAADTQAKAAEQALALQKEYAQKGVDAQTAATGKIEGYQSPFLTAGTNNLNTLSSLLKQPGEGLLSTYGAFKAPTLAEAEADPGYQFQLEQGTNAINKDAAARGTLLSGNTGVALQKFGQGLASTTYGDVYNRALNSYLTNFNTWNTGQGNQFSRLQALANMGQHSADTLTSAQQAGANNLADIYGRVGTQGGQELNNAGAARASGIVGSTNAYGGAINSVAQLPLLMSMLKPGASPGASTAQPQFNPLQLQY